MELITKQDIQHTTSLENLKYDDAVILAKQLLLKQDLIKLRIAKLALQVCTIRHGGRSSGIYTLSNFADDTGIPRKRLSHWVLTYKNVVSFIEHEIKTNLDWDIAQRVNDILAKHNTYLRKENSDEKSRSSYIEYNKELAHDLFNKEKERRSSTKQMHLRNAKDYLSRAEYHLSLSNTEEYMATENLILAKQLCIEIGQRSLELITLIEELENGNE